MVDGIWTKPPPFKKNKKLENFRDGVVQIERSGCGGREKWRVRAKGVRQRETEFF